MYQIFSISFLLYIWNTLKIVCSVLEDPLEKAYQKEGT